MLCGLGQVTFFASVSAAEKKGVIIPVLMFDRQEQSPAEPIVSSSAYSPTSVEGILCNLKPKEGGMRLGGGLQNTT